MDATRRPGRHSKAPKHLDDKIPVAVPDLRVEELEEEEQVVHVTRASLQGQQPTRAQVDGFGSGQPAGRLAPLGPPEGRPAALQHAARQPLHLVVQVNPLGLLPRAVYED